MKKTILFVRSSAPSHCLSLLEYLRETRHPDGDTRWIWILQPQVEASFTSRFPNVEVDVWRYDQGAFTYRNLKNLLETKMQDASERIDIAYVPFNTLDGKGYFQIMRWANAAGIPKIMVYPPDGNLREITFSSFVRQRAGDRAVEFLETVVLIAVLPFVAFYFFLRSMVLRLRHRIAPNDRTAG